MIYQAHARGVWILMDFVLNLWSNQHHTFLEAVKDQNSEHTHGYTFEQCPQQYKSFFHVKTLPPSNLRHGPARQHILDAARYWLEFGVDGYRVDYCIGPSPVLALTESAIVAATGPKCKVQAEGGKKRITLPPLGGVVLE